MNRGLLAPHLQVEGVIGKTIRFELLLPDEWNGVFVMGGGGGFVGTVSNRARDSVNKGYATVGTDTGHQWPSGNTAGWALNNVEAQVNFGHLAIHRTAEVTKFLISTYYESDPKKSYFVGCSTGGGQALMEAQRYPDDFDGVLSEAPVVQHTGLAAERLNNARFFFPTPGKYEAPLVSDEQLRKLHAEIMLACDEQDGVKDGLLDDPRKCRFDLEQVTWLSPEQRRALQAVYDGPRNKHGQIYPGMPLGTEDQWSFWKGGNFPGLFARDKAPNAGFALGIEFCRYFIFNHPDWDYAAYNFDNWQQDASRVSTFVDANNPDLSRFNARGGKLILWHGWNDGPLTPLASIQYFEEVERRDPTVRDYFRLYLLPGVTHCQGGPGPDQVDWLSLLRDWVEHGKAPERVVATKRNGKGETLMSRPVYPYPLKAAYTGSGSINEADSFQLPAAKSSRN